MECSKIEHCVPANHLAVSAHSATFAGMNNQGTPTPHAMSAALIAVIKAGAVHMFPDEAATLARQCVEEIRTKWPLIFRKAKAKKAD